MLGRVDGGVRVVLHSQIPEKVEQRVVCSSNRPETVLDEIFTDALRHVIVRIHICRVTHEEVTEGSGSKAAVKRGASTDSEGVTTLLTVIVSVAIEDGGRR